MNVAPTPAEVLADAARLLTADGRLALCTIVRAEGSTSGKPGWRLLARPDGEVRGNLGGGSFEALVAADARAKAADVEATSELKRYYLTETAVRGEATGMACGGMLEVFLEVLEAPPLLVVCGGGPVGQAVAAAGHLSGFDLLVVEDRASFRKPDLYPPGTRFGAVSRGFQESFLAPFPGREIFVAVVSRCWQTDAAALASVLRQAPRRLAYLGLMGSRRKIGRVREELTEKGLALDGLPFHAPIGLPIGGDTPGEIAISVLAEVIAARRRGETSEVPAATTGG